MTAAELLGFMRGLALAVQASVAPSGSPQAAGVGVLVTDGFELLFDADAKSRKVDNLGCDPRIAFVLGGTLHGDEQTVQYEGIADDVRARASWIRYSDFNQDSPEIVEFDLAQLGGGGAEAAGR